MYLVLNSDSRIVASANYSIDETDCSKREETVIYIHDSYYKPEMVGLLYINTEPFFLPAPSPYHSVVNHTYILSESGLTKCWTDVRKMRNGLLTRTDWTQLGDCVLNTTQQEHMSSLRTELRNITQMPDAMAALHVLRTMAIEIDGDEDA
jgi:Phage tail assembly chaperone protein